ncbi:MAG: AI-2E family transporter [Flavobacteriales bacterium]|nr:AI-2E family transporter [Flavobacteriales bacterium]
MERSSSSFCCSSSCSRDRPSPDSARSKSAAIAQGRIRPPQDQKLSLILQGLVALFYAHFITKSILVPLLFALLLAVLLNRVIVLKVVASRVELKALVSIIAVMAGGARWGNPGMFLAVPLTAILKVILDRAPGLQPIGFVLGDDEPKARSAIFRVKALAKLGGERK